MDSFCPLGPSIVHKCYVKDPQNLTLTSKVNGVIKQNGNTKDMIYKIDEIIEHLTQAITLKPGDIILTGTPAGVGMHRSPPEYLKPGDVVESEIQCIGTLLNKVVEG
uniref:Fumarylacetoacetase-like C-terminal domain-containing protein n=1 Tax=Megaselia scalaris TaxID=36166 RepID=T1GTX6_MEGSC